MRRPDACRRNSARRFRRSAPARRPRRSWATRRYRLSVRRSHATMVADHAEARSIVAAALSVRRVASALRMPAMCCARASPQLSLRLRLRRWRRRRTGAPAPARSRSAARRDGQFESDEGDGWTPPTAPWLSARSTASRGVLRQTGRRDGRGRDHSFMAMLGKHFRDAQFLITGARPAFQRPRAQRISAHTVCDEADRLCGERARGARGA
jgi:hypothetical protein